MIKLNKMGCCKFVCDDVFINQPPRKVVILQK